MRPNQIFKNGMFTNQGSKNFQAKNHSIWNLITLIAILTLVGIAIWYHKPVALYLSNLIG